MKKILLFTVIVMAALAITVSQVSAILLTFDYGAPIATVWPFGGNLDQTYGDNVTGSPHGTNNNEYGPDGGWTPNVEVNYLGDWENWSGGWKGSSAMHHPTVDDYHIIFTPDAGFGVSVNAFTFDIFAGATSLDISWTLYEDDPNGSVIESGSAVGINSNVDVDTADTVYFGTIVLEVSQTPNTADGYLYGAIDNVEFSQYLPGDPNVLTVTPSVQNVTAPNDITTFDVINGSTNTGMDWTASESASWFDISSGSSGTDDGTIEITFEQNTGLARSDDITITAPGAANSPTIVTVAQAAGVSTCGDFGFPPHDTTGPRGVPDCIVDIYDFWDFAFHWLTCTPPLVCP